MAVKEALDKISERHSDVIGAIVACDGQYYHNLEAPYDMVSVNEVMDLFTEMLEQTDLFDGEGFDFSELMIDFPGHSFIVRKLDDGGLLAVLAPRLARGHLIKLQVGLALFGKSVKKALAAEAEATANAEEAQAEASPEYPELPEVVRPAVPSDFEDTGRVMSRPRKGFRGGRSFYTKAIDALSDVTDRQEDTTPEETAEATGEDGVPLRPDGTPMKKKMYRGQVYYE